MPWNWQALKFGLLSEDWLVKVQEISVYVFPSLGTDSKADGD